MSPDEGAVEPPALVALVTVVPWQHDDHLVAKIADALAPGGEYVARIDARTTQRVVDFNWSARRAGRRLGIRVPHGHHVSES